MDNDTQNTDDIQIKLALAEKLNKDYQQYSNIVLAALVVLLTVIFTIFLPIWQFLSYNVHCEKLDDKCTVKETMSGKIVKTFKLSEVKGLDTKDIKITSGDDPITIPYIVLVKKDGSNSFARGLLADGRDIENFLKFNNFVNSYDKNTLDYTNRNVYFKDNTMGILLCGLFLMFFVPVITAPPKFEWQEKGLVRVESKSFNIKYLIILAFYIFMIVVSVFAHIEAEKINDENRAKADAIRGCTERDLFFRSDGEKIIYLFYSDKAGMHTIYECDMKNMTGEKLKNVYKASEWRELEEKRSKEILYESENALTISWHWGADYRNVCIHKLTFYAQNSCLEAGECYVEAKFCPQGYPEEEFETKKYNLILVPEETDKNEIVLKKIEAHVSK